VPATRAGDGGQVAWTLRRGGGDVGGMTFPNADWRVSVPHRG
jgi:hypothetical protein